ncbi:hypothetical protein NQ317_003985 [Molorchus minor]|uniref:Uncharacterized protein n=1 Tax=Molorchus minor TaxID=1323400 RepID=A0ABQ9K2S7_9CUCU|nr:hypothetical protein NQ317_003985 [Molorchus minor]
MAPWERLKFILVTHLLYSPENPEKPRDITNSNNDTATASTSKLNQHFERFPNKSWKSKPPLPQENLKRLQFSNYFVYGYLVLFLSCLWVSSICICVFSYTVAIRMVQELQPRDKLQPSLMHRTSTPYAHKLKLVYAMHWQIAKKSLSSGETIEEEEELT